MMARHTKHQTYLESGDSLQDIVTGGKALQWHWQLLQQLLRFLCSGPLVSHPIQGIIAHGVPCYWQGCFLDWNSNQPFQPLTLH